MNVDQSLLPFVIDIKSTYEYVEPGAKNHNTWIAQPGSGLDKRLSKDEKLAWYTGVDIYFQKNAWMDTKVCCQWAKRTLTNFVKKENLSRHVLILDNLEAQTKSEFKEIVNGLS